MGTLLIGVLGTALPKVTGRPMKDDNPWARAVMVNPSPTQRANPAILRCMICLLPSQGNLPADSLDGKGRQNSNPGAGVKAKVRRAPPGQKNSRLLNFRSHIDRSLSAGQPRSLGLLAELSILPNFTGLPSV